MNLSTTEGMPMTTTMMHDRRAHSDRYLMDAGPSPLPQRKKLELKPRSRRRSTSAKGDPFASVSTTTTNTTKSSPSSSTTKSPFGDARPREEVLKSRGLDVKAIDSRIEEKAEKKTFTVDQEIQIEAAQDELTKAEARFREANEKELPEEAFRLQMEEKRIQLNELVTKFTKLNTAEKNNKSSSPRGTAAAAAAGSRHRSRSPAHRYHPNSVFTTAGGGRRR